MLSKISTTQLTKHICVIILFAMLIVRSCGMCGKVMSENDYTDAPDFVKGPSGEVRFATVLY